MSDENGDNGEPALHEVLSEAAEEERLESGSATLKRDPADIAWPSDEGLIKSYTINRMTFFGLGSLSILVWVGVVSAIMIVNSVNPATMHYTVLTALIGSVTSIVIGGLFMLGRALPLRASK